MHEVSCITVHVYHFLLEKLSLFDFVTVKSCVGNIKESRRYEPYNPELFGFEQREEFEREGERVMLKLSVVILCAVLLSVGVNGGCPNQCVKPLPAKIIARSEMISEKMVEGK